MLFRISRLCGRPHPVEVSFCHIRAENLSVNADATEKSGEILLVNKTQRAILALLLENGRFTYDALAEKLGKTRETVRANLRILEKNGLIERVGADKNGYWKVSLPHE